MPLALAGRCSILGEDETALNLFYAALEGGTAMDIHRLRAECMVGIGDIMIRSGDLVQAKEMWTGAHPLFVRSCQMKDAAAVDKRLERLSLAEKDPSYSLLHIWDTGVGQLLDSSDQSAAILVWYRDANTCALTSRSQLDSW
ncbi:hypothetical protein B0H19DRAFT_1276691 [Mycena capillaripes]|nr:hypothetical protein B0H19DRAFT_1276691 [Mycena capillaripes]